MRSRNRPIPGIVRLVLSGLILLPIQGCGKRESRPAAPTCASGTRVSVPPRESGKKSHVPASPLARNGNVRLDWNIPTGLQCKVAHAGLLKLSIATRVKVYNQPETTIPDQQDVSWKKQYADTYQLVKDRKPAHILRHIEQDNYTSRNPQSNKPETQDLPTKDSTVTMTIKSDGTVELNQDADPQVVDEFKKVRIGTLMPQREVGIGEEWPVTEDQLKACFPLVTRGTGTLKLMKLELDPALKQYVAEIAGELSLECAITGQDGQTLPLQFQGKISVKQVPALGLEILRKLDGAVIGQCPIKQGAVSGQLTIKGELHETVKSEPTACPSLAAVPE